MKARIEKKMHLKKIEQWFRQVFLFSKLVVSKLKVVKFSKFFEIYFFRLTLKEPILLIFL
jgi:hypothetical protein